MSGLLVRSADMFGCELGVSGTIGCEPSARMISPNRSSPDGGSRGGRPLPAFSNVRPASTIGHVEALTSWKDQLMSLLRRRPKDVSPALAALHGRAAEASEVEITSLLAIRRAKLARSTQTVGNALEPAGEQYAVPVGEESRLASASPEKAILLYRLARAAAPGKVVEFGSGFGVSGAHFVSGLQAGGGGTFVTIDAVGTRSALAAETIAEISAPAVEVRLVVGLFDDHFDQMKDAKVIYVDGNHYANPTRRYVEAALTSGDPEALLILDDIDGYSPEMDDIWRALRKDTRFEFAGRIGDLGILGVGALGHRLR